MPRTLLGELPRVYESPDSIQHRKESGQKPHIRHPEYRTTEKPVVRVKAVSQKETNRLSDVENELDGKRSYDFAIDTIRKAED